MNVFSLYKSQYNTIRLGPFLELSFSSKIMFVPWWGKWKRLVLQGFREPLPTQVSGHLGIIKAQQTECAYWLQ